MRKYWLVIVLPSILIGCAQPDDADKPWNILFIAIDDLRPQLGCYDLPYMHTPNLDQLASQGFVFDRHYVQVPTCGASRYSLLTGRRPSASVHLGNNVFEQETAGKPETSAPESFVHYLRRSGYQTAAVGKISHSPDGRVYGYTDQPSAVRELPNSWDHLPRVYGRWGTGWNAFFGYADGENRQSRDKQVPPWEVVAGSDTLYPDGLITRQAIALLDSLPDEKGPFFLGVGYFKPHLPWTVPQYYWDLYRDDAIPPVLAEDIPQAADPTSLHQSGEFNQYLAVQEHPDLNHPASPAYAQLLRHAYAACVSYVDAQVGALIQALQERNLADRTMIVVWGDHGWHLGDQRVWGKHTLSEYALRSPLLMYLPGKESQAAHIAQPVETVDIFPTILDCIHLDLPENVQGTSLLPLIEGASEDVLATACSFWQQGMSMRTQRYRLTRYLDNDSIYTELFDYQLDPAETINMAEQLPDIVKALSGEMSSCMPVYLQEAFKKVGFEN